MHRQGGYLEHSVGVTGFPGRCSSQGGALQVVPPVQAHVCGEDVAHHHKPGLQGEQ